jgi:hypothetical protein
MIKTIEEITYSHHEKAVSTYRHYTVRVAAGTSFKRINGFCYLSGSCRANSLRVPLNYNIDCARIFTTRRAALNNIKKLENLGLECCLLIEVREKPLAKTVRELKLAERV